MQNPTCSIIKLRRQFAPLIDGSFLETWEAPMSAIGTNFLVERMISTTDLTPSFTIRTNRSSSFRSELCTFLHLQEYDVADPRQIPEELRTPVLQKLCEMLDHFDELEVEQKLLVVQLLGAMCFHQTVADLGSKDLLAIFQQSPRLGYAIALSRWIRQLETSDTPDTIELEEIAKRFSGRESMAAATQIAVYHQKGTGNLDLVEKFLAIAAQHFQNISFEEMLWGDQCILRSAFLRGDAIGPWQKGDFVQMLERMRECEEFAIEAERAFAHGTEEEKFMARENRLIQMQSLSKTMLALKDPIGAIEQIQRAIDLDPLEPRYWHDRALFEMQLGKYETAAETYLIATSLGPPQRDVFFYMAGRAYEEAKKPDLAIDCFLQCVQVDPQSISAFEKLVELAESVGDQSLLHWGLFSLNTLNSISNSQATEFTLAS